MLAAVASSSSSDHKIKEETNAATELGAGTKRSAESATNGEARHSATAGALQPAQHPDLQEAPPSPFMSESNEVSNAVDENKQQQYRASGNGSAVIPSSNETTGDDHGGRVASTSNTSGSGNFNGALSGAAKAEGNGVESTLGKQETGDLSNRQGQQATPLPNDLQVVLTEIATTGTSSWLHWREDGNQVNGNSTAFPLCFTARGQLGWNARGFRVNSREAKEFCHRSRYRVSQINHGLLKIAFARSDKFAVVQRRIKLSLTCSRE